jgi:Polymerase beta, Nucleotidyltransferase
MFSAAQAAAYIADLVATHPGIREVWLFGSRANGTETNTSDWDYFAFADSATYEALQSDLRFRCDGIHLMLVTDGERFENPWPSQGREERATLGDWQWKQTEPASATYWATHPPEAEGDDVPARWERALRVYPPTA